MFRNKRVMKPFFRSREKHTYFMLICFCWLSQVGNAQNTAF